MLLVVGIAYVGLGLRDEISYNAEAVFYVPANVAGQQPPGDQDAAVKLAKTYATALPLNDELLAGAARKSNESELYVQSHLMLTNDSGTSLLRVSYAGTSPEATAAVLSFISRSITATNPPKPVSAGSIRIVNLPKNAVTTGGSLRDRIPLGIVLGIVAGLALAYLLEMIRPRIDTVRECRSTLGVPVLWWGGGADQRLWTWIRRNRESSAAPCVELVPADRRAARVTPIIEDEVRTTLQSVSSAAQPRNGANGTSTSSPTVTVRALNADHDDALEVYTVLVLRRGALRATAQGASETLRLQSRQPTDVILAGSPRSFRIFREWPSDPERQP